MPTYTFTGPTAKAERRGQCPTCHKPVKRSRTFEHTVSPFNTHVDGTPKTWDEVRADVKAVADAWAPDPDIFEHDKCREQRLAPEPAGTVPMPAEKVQRSAEVRTAVITALDWAISRGLPVTALDVEPRRGVDTSEFKVDFGFSHEPGYIGLWARAFGLDRLKVDMHDSLHVRLSGEIGPDLRGHKSFVIWQRDEGPKNGGMSIDWARDQRTRRLQSYGTVALDELLAGLSRMGIAEVLPAAEQAVA